MNLEGGRRQKSRQQELPWESRGETPSVPRSDETPTAVQGTERPGADDLLEAAAAREKTKKEKGANKEILPPPPSHKK
mgnify:CR=1 FL=1